MRIVGVVALTGVLFFGFFTGLSLAKDPHGNTHAIFESGLVASAGGPVSVAGIPSTGTAFVIVDGKAEINEAGDLEVEVEGLVRSTDYKTTNDEIFASLVCAGTIVKSSGNFPISEAGDAKFEVPFFIDDSAIDECLGAIILVRRNGTSVDRGAGSDDPSNMRWLAISGFMPPMMVP